MLLSVNLGFAPGARDLGAEEGNPGESVCNQGAGLQGVTEHWHCGLDDTSKSISLSFSWQE